MRRNEEFGENNRSSINQKTDHFLSIINHFDFRCIIDHDFYQAARSDTVWVCENGLSVLNGIKTITLLQGNTSLAVTYIFEETKFPDIGIMKNTRNDAEDKNWLILDALKINSSP